MSDMLMGLPPVLFMPQKQAARPLTRRFRVVSEYDPAGDPAIGVDPRLNAEDQRLNAEGGRLNKSEDTDTDTDLSSSYSAFSLPRGFTHAPFAHRAVTARTADPCGRPGRGLLSSRLMLRNSSSQIVHSVDV